MKSSNSAALAFLLFAASAAADQPVGITAQQSSLDVMHEGKLVRIQRDPDSFAQIEPDFAMTSRPCPPYCIQPMLLAPGVETVGELEVLAFLQKITRGDESFLVIDSREADWLVRSGIIPGAIHLPWERLHPGHAKPEAIAEILELDFGASRDGPLWNFENARTLLFYCNGPWCGQSPTNIKGLLKIGYPADKIKWYRGGMQDWEVLGLTTVKPVN